ncbi:CHAT domain-containing protein [Actinomadura terrae]|uniref:CHAT domain-containing protein n=1 Tax=Actinomadura terrae TaxID=604353 RepID=UPI001FA72FAF|nr:CHAT domain-containing protein [Actinomadura terrae]
MGNEPATMLRVMVGRNEGPTRHYSYGLRTAGSEVGGALEYEYTVEVHQGLIEGVCNDINNVLRSALDRATSGQAGPGDLVDHRAKLAEYGHLLYKFLFQSTQGADEPEIVARMRLSPGPLLVRTYESLVPWDLLHDGTDFLGLTQDLGQGSVVQKVPLSGREVGRIERALIVGDPLGDLPMARAEAEHVAAWLTRQGTECTLLVGAQATLISVVRLLISTPFDLLHYCGHVSIMNKPADSGLMLHGREILNEAALRVAAMVGAPPVVFINGCQSARPIANLCLSFLTMGAKVVVGTRVEVSERSAKLFAEEFYQRLLKDQTAGSAVRNARYALLDEADAGWASFLLYSNPGVHITGGPPPVAAAAPPAAAEDDEGQVNYSASATELMRRAFTVAETSGLVTSVELLFALITETELQSTMVRGVGAERLAMLSAILHMIVGTKDGVVERQSEEIELSDTVHGVLLQAEEDATAQGRTIISPHDIALAFAGTDGGTSAEIPEVVGVTVRELFGLDAPAAPETDAPTETAPDTATNTPPDTATDAATALSDATNIATDTPTDTAPNTATDTPTDTAPNTATGTATGTVAPTEPDVKIAPSAKTTKPDPLLDANGKLPAELLDDGTLKAVTAALVLAAGKRRPVESHTFLQGFGAAGSTVLRRALEAQGSTAEDALHVLYAPGIRPKKFTQRSFGALTKAWDDGAGVPIGEAAVLRVLLSDPKSAAHMFLSQLGVDIDRLLMDLRSADPEPPEPQPVPDPRPAEDQREREPDPEEDRKQPSAG